MVIPKITLKDIAAKRAALPAAAESNLTTELKNFICWLFQNHELMTSEAQQYVDRVVEKFYAISGKNIAAMPDSPEKRQARRTHALGIGKHIRAESLLMQLNGDLLDRQEIEIKWQKYATDALQKILDLLFEVQANTGVKKNELSAMSLYFNAIDEVLAAIHLASHRYIIQSNAHFRNVIETLDRVELFFKDPSWIDVWSGDDHENIRRNLTPSKIRKLLGREENWDPLYSYYSKLGTHPSFEVFKARTFRNPDDLPTTARLFIGGTPIVHLQMSCFALGLNVVHRFAGSVLNHLSRFFNQDDASKQMKVLARAQKEFTVDFFVPWAAASGMDVSDIVKSFSEFELDGHDSI